MLTYFCLNCGDEQKPKRRLIFWIVRKCVACQSERLIWSNQMFYGYWKAMYEVKCLVGRVIKNLEAFQKVLEGPNG